MAENKLDLQERLSADGAVEWIRLEQLKADVPISCIDGRQCGHTVGAPGGNIGEFILLLSVLEWYVDDIFDEAVLNAFFHEYLTAFHRFYQHTDEHALRGLAAKLKGDERLREVWSDLEDEAWIGDFVGAVPEKFQSIMLEYLIDPDYVGCGHIKQLLLSPETYRVRLGLVQSALRVYFRRLWSGDEDVDFVVLEGSHDEQAVLTFHTREVIAGQTLVPAVHPSRGDLKVFVNHIPALRYMRWRGLRLFLASDLHPNFAGLQPWLIVLEIERLAERQFDETLSRLARDLPRRRVTFGEGRFEV